MSKTFLDTNILVHSLNLQDSSKSSISRSIIRNLGVRNEAVISTQVLQEFYVVATKKLSVKPMHAKSIVCAFENLEIVQIDFGLIKEAIDISMQYQISFWDSLIVAAAERSNSVVLFSEDLQHNQIIRSVRIVNPFIPEE